MIGLLWLMFLLLGWDSCVDRCYRSSKLRSLQADTSTLGNVPDHTFFSLFYLPITVAEVWT